MRLILLASLFIVSAFSTAVYMKTSGLAYLLNSSRWVAVILIVITCTLAVDIADEFFGGRRNGNRARHNDI